MQKVNAKKCKNNVNIIMKEVSEMPIKWIVTDMDGTLLNSHDRISEETKRSLLACQEKGIRLILASGRSYVRLMPYVRQVTHSIAMGNAASYVKKYASDVTGTNDEDGVAASLKRYGVL